MPGTHKSPLYKGISKNYKKMPKGQRGFKMTSPLLKKNMSGEEIKKVVEMNKKYKDNPEFKKWKDKKFGGKTTISEDNSKITIVKPKKS